MFGEFEFSQVSEIPIMEKENVFRELKNVSTESKFLLILLELKCTRLRLLHSILSFWNDWFVLLSFESKTDINSWEV